MAIVNVTPDSFYAGSRTLDDKAIRNRVREIIEQGADIIDIGAYSTRPGACEVSVSEEIDRLAKGMAIIQKAAPDIPVSVDTFRAEVAHVAITQMGCDIVNDISGGDMDDNMLDTVASLKCPYILMHMRGTPSDMQSSANTTYNDVTADVLSELSVKLGRATAAGINDVIIDPGFGFAKTMRQNYRLMSDLNIFKSLGCPILIGISRKSMLTRLLDIQSDNALNATTALNALALDRGADILRVHDVGAARQCVDIFHALKY